MNNQHQRAGFTFKQFHVFHDRCAMKVGTDAVLLGAWTPSERAERVLDIGAGSGIVALMLAQRGAQKIDALEIDEAASAQAEENFANSPWADHLRCIHCSLQDYAAEPYDLIVSNPPFFHPGQTLKTPARQAARHCGELSHDQLLRDAARLSHGGSRLALVLPFDQHVIATAPDFGWYLTVRCDVLPKPDRPANRCLLLFRREPVDEVQCSEFSVRSSGGEYSREFIELTGDFYLGT